MKLDAFDRLLGSIDAALGALPRPSPHEPAIARIRADLGAARFHLSREPNATPLLAILGGTGTGKSTLLNRLLGADVTAASFKRTFTAGPIAVAADASRIPKDWLAIEHSVINSSRFPVRGQPDLLMIAVAPGDITANVTVIDTPDLDGDQPAHHAQADRTFRWVDAVLFLVTPEKYQMTELLPYYRLARRYGLTTIHVMNKVEEQAVVDDYAQQAGATVFAIPRDDAAYDPPAETNLTTLRQTILDLRISERAAGNAQRIADLMDRLRDQIIEPLRTDRREVDRLIASLKAMQSPGLGVDVNPLTQQLQRRMQQRSILYLMGPARMLDRVRQVPGMLARLPRTTWDLLRSGRTTGNGHDDAPQSSDGGVPDFRATLVDQFTLVQSRIDDAIRSHPKGLTWIESADTNYAQSKLDAQMAGQIADDEIAQLRDWLQKQWNSTPRDTAIMHKFLKILPGGAKLSQWSEAAPYLLAVVVATHHAFFGPIDLMILGGYSLATWIGEKLSNEVAARVKTANNSIASGFTDLTRRQIQSTCAWLEKQAPTTQSIRQLSEVSEELMTKLEQPA